MPPGRSRDRRPWICAPPAGVPDGLARTGCVPGVRAEYVRGTHKRRRQQWSPDPGDHCCLLCAAPRGSLHGPCGPWAGPAPRRIPQPGRPRDKPHPHRDRGGGVMRVGRSRRQGYTLKVVFPESGPTLEQLQTGLMDWFHHVLITGGYVRSHHAQQDEAEDGLRPNCWSHGPR